MTEIVYPHSPSGVYPPFPPLWQVLRCRGFTLIELSLVMVIIGFLIGGVLVGQDLIFAAKVRNATSQLSQMETAYNTFRIKYNCIPGDCPNATDYFGNDYIVITFNAGYCNSQPSGAHGNGNGNGLIDAIWCEQIQAVVSLKLAGLVQNKLNGMVWLEGINNSLTYFSNGDVYTPSPRDNNAITWFNYSPGTGCPRDSALSPIEASAIDQKIDDGIPNKGKFWGTDAAAHTCSIVANSCSKNGAYKTNSDYTCRALYYIK